MTKHTTKKWKNLNFLLNGQNPLFWSFPNFLVVCPSFFIRIIFLNFHFWKNLNFIYENWLHLFSSLWIILRLNDSYSLGYQEETADYDDYSELSNKRTVHFILFEQLIPPKCLIRPRPSMFIKFWEIYQWHGFLRT